MRYTHHRGLARVASWVRLKFAAMNQKKAGDLELEKLLSLLHFHVVYPILQKNPGFRLLKTGVL